MSAYDKFGLGYGDHRYNGILSYENEVLQSVFKSKESDFENQPMNDRFAEGMHVVPPPMTGNYMPSGPEIEIDYSQFTYGPKQSLTSESESQSSEVDTCESNISTEPSELVSETIVNESNVESQPKVWSDAPIIEEYESDSDDECVVIPTKQDTPSFANQQVKTPRENVKNQSTHSQKPKVNKNDLGHGFAVRACFVCGSLNHLIRDCDFHEKRMARKAGLNNGWNNVQRVNKQNQFVPSAVLTRIIPVLTSTAMKVNTVKPIVNRVRPANVFHKTHSPTRPFKKTTVLRPKFSNQKFNTAKDYPHRALKNKGIVDSGCSRHMTGNKAYLDEFQDFNGGPVAFGGSRGYITGKGKIKTGKLDFEDVCFVKELQHFNLFSVSQICDKKNKVLFTDSECLVLSPEFKLPDENQVLLKIPRQNNMYSFNLENIVPTGGLACLIAKATTDESNKWHRRLGHVNFKNLNKLVKGNLVRGLPSKIFQNDHTCVACQKGKQHKASCKAKAVSSISQTLQLLHMDLFGPTSVRSLNHKTYCLVITDDFSRFSWVFFLRTKDETSAILKDFIRQIENQLNQKVKTIRSDNGTEFKNKEVIEFCGIKGIKREYSNARTPQQNGVAERKNRTLIEAARTMLADSFLPNTFWAEAVSTACYVLNRVLVTKPHNKTPYELLTGKIPIISYIRPFGCHVTILNTIDHLGKFAGKSDEGFLVGYSLQSKAFRVYNLETKRVEENLHITFLENKPNVAGKGPTWLFDLDYLTDSMNYHPVSSENQANLHAGQQEANQNAGTEEIIDVGDSDKEDDSAQDCFVLPIWPSYSSTNTPALTTDDKREGPREEEQVFMDDLERLKKQEKEAYEEAEALRKKFETLVIKEGVAKPSSTNIFSTVSTPAKASSTNPLNTASIPVSTASPYEGLSLADPTHSEEDDSEIPPLEDIYQNSTDGIFTTSSFDDEGAVADFTNLETVVNVSPIPTSRIHSTHPRALILGDPNSAVQTRSKVNTSSGAHAFVSYVVKALMGYIKLRAWYDTIIHTFLLKAMGYRRGTMTKNSVLIEGTKNDIHTCSKVYVDDISFGFYKRILVKQKEDGIFISQDKYVAEILKKFDFANVKTASTPIETQEASSSRMREPVIGDVLLYSLRSSPKTSNLSYYAVDQNLDRKSTTGAEYVACLMLLWASFVDSESNVYDYGFQYFMNTKIYIDNEARPFALSDLRLDDADGIDTFPGSSLLLMLLRKWVKYLMSHKTESSMLQSSEVPIETLALLPQRPSPTYSPFPASIQNFWLRTWGHSSSDKSLSGNEGDMTIQGVYDLCLSLCKQVSDQAKEIQDLKAQITKLKKQAKPVIKHHKAYLKSVSLKQRFPRRGFP
ncbi:putative ribonuclease H-like domain-containing protein [Tanacetum coccineum]